MENILQSYIEEYIYFLLRNNPDLSLDELKKSALSSLSKMDLIEKKQEDIEKIVENKANIFIERGVLNPFWLSNKYNIIPHLFFFNAQAGWFETLLEQIKEMNIKVSQYTLYGESDLLIIIWCSEVEAKIFEKKFDPNYIDIKHISIKSTHLFCGYRSYEKSYGNSSLDTSLINSIIEKYNINLIKKNDLIKNDILLGSTWAHKNNIRQGVSAFVGIITIGHDLISYSDVLNALMRNTLVEKSLLDFFEVDRGPIYHYFVKIVCQNMEELDAITNHISFIRFGRTRFEGVTFIVAKEIELLPSLTKQNLALVSELPNMSFIEEAAHKTLSQLGKNSTLRFNKFDGTRQLILLRTFREILDNSLNNKVWDEIRDKALQAAIASFSHASMIESESVNLEGSVMDLATTVEGYLKYTLRMIADFVFDKNYAKAQKELKLPTRDFRKMTLGKTINAFREMKKHPDLSFLVEALNDDYLDRLEKFTENRNKWAHGGMKDGYSVNQLIDETRIVFIEGIELLRWIGGEILPKLDASNSSRKPQPLSSNNKTGVFLSYATADKKIADRVAKGIKAFDFPLWYSDWALRPGDSIVDKISEGLSKSDTLVVLLSKNSVKSKWVTREINTTLMDQLSGKNIKVIPVLIDNCEVPKILMDILYVDMKNDFQSGLLDLLKYLKDDT